MDKLIITAAVNGGITSRDKNPNVPYTPEEIANEVYNCWNAGASIAHIHARSKDGKPDYNHETYQEIISRIRDKCNILINLSTSGLNLPAHLEKSEAWNHLRYKPEIASFNCGSVNHGKKPFINPPDLARKLADDLKFYKVKPEVEVYHSGIIQEAIGIFANEAQVSPLYFTFALGIPGGTPANCKNLINLIDNLPQDSTWSALAIGKDQLPINTHTILLGGHVRTGLEDNVYYKKSELVTSNSQLVERIVRLSIELGRAVATPSEARTILNI